MISLDKINPIWPLRLGFGFMYIYSGYSIFSSPGAWTWAVTGILQRIIETVMPVEAYLRVQGAAEIIVGLLFFAWFSGKAGLRIAAIFACIEMAGILLFVGIDMITFRDLGLLGGALAVLILAFRDGDAAGDYGRDKISSPL